MIAKKFLVLLLFITIVALAGFVVLKIYSHQSFSIAIIHTVDAGPDNFKVAQGVVAELTDQGYQQNKDFYWSYSGDGVHTTVSEVSWLGPQAMQGSPNAILALGAMAAEVAIASASASQVPVAFVASSNPIENPSVNVTGILTCVLGEAQINYLKEIQPNLKSLGVVYEQGSHNSQLEIEDMKIAAQKLKIRLFSSTTTIDSVQKLAANVDALFVDNVSRDTLEKIVKVGIASKTPVYVANMEFVLKDSHADNNTTLAAFESKMSRITPNMEIMHQGVVATISIDKYALGRQLGKIVARLIRGEQSGEIPVSSFTKQQISVNYELVEKLGLESGVKP